MRVGAVDGREGEMRRRRERGAVSALGSAAVIPATGSARVCL